jgi:hypothetical protein
MWGVINSGLGRQYTPPASSTPDGIGTPKMELDKGQDGIAVQQNET